MKSFSRRELIAATASVALLPSRARAAARGLSWFDVRDFGAVEGGVSTAAIQKAIDGCAASGGGTVLISQGRYVAGTLFLKSNVTLRVEAGAVLLASPDILDYAKDTGRNMYAHEPHMDRCFLFAQDAINVCIEGMGIIDGQGSSFPNVGDTSKSRPMLLRLLNCRNVSLRDVTLQNPAAWTSAFLYCSDIRVNGITISSRARGNGDGLDFDGCQDVRISNCRLDNSDDSICLQSSDPSRVVRNIVVTNCVMTSQWAAIRIGLLSRGLFQDVAVSNCVFHDIAGEAIKIQMAEGGRMDGFVFSNIVMRNVARPVFITLNSFPFLVDAPAPPPPMQSLKNITFSDMRVEADGASVEATNSFFAILGSQGHLIENIRFHNIVFSAAGGGTEEASKRRTVPELDGVRPEHKALGGPLPSYGMFARHVKGLSVTNVAFETAAPDARPAIFCDDVDGCQLSGITLGSGSHAESLIVLRNVTAAAIQGCVPLEHSSTFLMVEGSRSAQIDVFNNDLRLARRVFRQTSEVAEYVVTTRGNSSPSIEGGT